MKKLIYLKVKVKIFIGSLSLSKHDISCLKLSEFVVVSYRQTRNNIGVGGCVSDRYRGVRALTPSAVNSQTLRSSRGLKTFGCHT